MVAGDPERAVAVQRWAQGVPMGDGLRAQVKALADECGAEWLL
jgi:hypothetical protein